MKAQYIILTGIILLLVFSAGVYAYNLNREQQLDLATTFFIIKLKYPDLTREQNLQLAREDFLIRAGALK
jgi:hypothetical protein